MEVMQGNPARTAELRKLSYVGLTMVEPNLLQISDRRLRLIAMSYSIYHRQSTCIRFKGVLSDRGKLFSIKNLKTLKNLDICLAPSDESRL
jgi:hypothetical protein